MKQIISQKYFLDFTVYPFIRLCKKLFSFFYLYTSTFFHEATFINAKLLTYKYMHIYSHTLYAFIKKVKKSDKIVLLRWLVMIFFHYLLWSPHTHITYVCMYVSTFTRNIYPVVKPYRVCHFILCKYSKYFVNIYEFKIFNFVMSPRLYESPEYNANI